MKYEDLIFVVYDHLDDIETVTTDGDEALDYVAREPEFNVVPFANLNNLVGRTIQGENDARTSLEEIKIGIRDD